MQSWLWSPQRSSQRGAAAAMTAAAAAGEGGASLPASGGNSRVGSTLDLAAAATNASGDANTPAVLCFTLTPPRSLADADGSGQGTPGWATPPMQSSVGTPLSSPLRPGNPNNNHNNPPAAPSGAEGPEATPSSQPPLSPSLWGRAVSAVWGGRAAAAPAGEQGEGKAAGDGGGGGGSSGGGDAGGSGDGGLVTGVPAPLGGAFGSGSGSGNGIGGNMAAWQAAPVCVRLADGREVQLAVPDDTVVAELAAWLGARAGLAPDRLRLSVHEVPPPPGAECYYSIASLARSVVGGAASLGSSLAAAGGIGGGSSGGSSVGSGGETGDGGKAGGGAGGIGGGGGGGGVGQLLREWAGYLVLPEAVNRELQGSGVIGWTYRRLALALRLLRSSTRLPSSATTGVTGGSGGLGDDIGGGGGLLVEAHSLRGTRALLEVGARVDAAGLRRAVECELGVAPQQQRLVVYELPPAWAPLDALSHLLLRGAALNVSLAVAMLSMAKSLAAMVPLGGRLLGGRLLGGRLLGGLGIGGGAGAGSGGGTGKQQDRAVVRVECGGRGYTFELPGTATLADVAALVQRQEQQRRVTRVC